MVVDGHLGGQLSFISSEAEITGPRLSLVSLSLKMEVYFRVGHEGQVHNI